MSKPHVFVASSGEKLKVARVLQSQLERDAIIEIWPTIFEPSGNILDSILSKMHESDFGIFIFEPDDKLNSRSKDFDVVRDNVILEAGISAGVLGRERTFLITERSRFSGMRIPSDLNGFTLVDYEVDQTSGEVDEVAIGSACNKIRKQMENLGGFSHPFPQRFLEHQTESLRTLTALASITGHDKGISAWWKELHRSIQFSFDQLWPEKKAFVTLRLPIEEPDGYIRTHFLNGPPSVSIRPKFISHEVPETIPVEGSLAGLALCMRKPQLVPNVKATPEKIDEESRDYYVNCIGSVGAWPILMDSAPFGVIEVDSPAVGFLSADNEYLCRIMDLSVAKFSLAAEIWQLTRIRIAQ